MEKRNIGAEILQGVREIKRGQYGRLVTAPAMFCNLTPHTIVLRMSEFFMEYRGFRGKIVNVSPEFISGQAEDCSGNFIGTFQAFDAPGLILEFQNTVDDWLDFDEWGNPPLFEV